MIRIKETSCTIHWIEIYPVDSVINLLSNWALIAPGESVSYLSTLGSSGLGSSKFVLNVKGHVNERWIRSVPLKQIYRWKPIRRRFCSKTWCIIKWSVCWGPCNHFLSLCKALTCEKNRNKLNCKCTWMSWLRTWLRYWPYRGVNLWVLPWCFALV